MKSNDIHIRAILQEMPQSSITKIRLKITCLKFHLNFPGANELIPRAFSNIQWDLLPTDLQDCVKMLISLWNLGTKMPAKFQSDWITLVQTSCLQDLTRSYVILKQSQGYSDMAVWSLLHDIYRCSYWLVQFKPRLNLLTSLCMDPYCRHISSLDSI